MTQQDDEPIGGSTEEERAEETTFAEPADQAEQSYGEADTTRFGDPQPSSKRPSEGELSDAAGETYSEPDPTDES